jgi:hypothetical protein
VGRVAVDFGVSQGAKRSADIRSDLGQGQRQNQRDPFQYFSSLLDPFLEIVSADKERLVAAKNPVAGACFMR